MRARVPAVLLVLACSVAALLAWSGPALAQGEQIEGTVVDDFAASIPGITLVIRSEDGGFSEETTSDENGQFTVPLPEPGSYVVEVDADSLPVGLSLPEESASIAVDVSAGETASVPIQLSRQEAITGTLRFEGRGVQGVILRVQSAAAGVSEQTTSDRKGNWQILLPSAGRYRVTLVTESLPEDVFVTEGARTVLNVEVESGQAKTLIFPLGTSTREVQTDWDLAAQLFVEGIRFGLLLALAAIGLSLIYGTTGLVNFAHAELVTFGAIVAWYLNSAGIQLILAAAIALVASGLLGAVQDIGLWRQLRRRRTGLISMMIVSIGLSILLRYFFLYIFGGETETYSDYEVQVGYTFGPISLAPKDLISMALATLVLVGVALWLLFTRVGKATRAVADNPALAAASGIDVERVVLVVWVVGAILAGLGGVLLGISQQIRFDMGFLLLLLIFAGVTLGGLGTAFGALVGSMVVGVFVTVSTVWIPPELKNVAALGVLILILLVRPQGILGSAERVG